MSNKKAANANSSSTGRGGYQPFDNATRTYRVARTKEGLPAVGTTFTAAPWGDFYWIATGLAKTVTDSSEITNLLDGGFIDQIAGPRKATTKPAEQPAEKA
jgi:hypothetical protein